PAVVLEIGRGIVLGLPFLVVLTIALFSLQLLSRRFQPGLKEQLHQPGTAACGAAILAIAIQIINFTFVYFMATIKWGLKPSFSIINEILIDSITKSHFIEWGTPGVAVTAVWLALAWSGRLHPAPNWLDRAGRCLGLAWILLMILDPWLLVIFGT